MLQSIGASKQNAKYLNIPKQILGLLPLHFLINTKVLHRCYRTLTFLKLSSHIGSCAIVRTMGYVISGGSITWRLQLCLHTLKNHYKTWYIQLRFFLCLIHN